MRDRFEKQRRGRFERLKIIFPILLAGWIPSILTLVVSYTILTKTLESRILSDRQTFIQLVGHLVNHDLSRTSGIIEYYQTLPEVAKILSAPNPQAAAEQWLSSAFYSHPLIDGMFMTAPDGRLIASIPNDPVMTAASSLRISPNKFSVRMTSKRRGSIIKCMAQAST